jgi:hypothetical protein
VCSILYPLIADIQGGEGGGRGHNLCAAYKMLIWCVPEEKFPDFRITCFDETCRIFCFPKKIEDDIIQMLHAIYTKYQSQRRIH